VDCSVKRKLLGLSVFAAFLLKKQQQKKEKNARGIGVNPKEPNIFLLTLRKQRVFFSRSEM
jgi:hypothetical protein